nr:RNA-directed DNA polymerase, eukaryota [Tanacetum cinerariifolium]
DEEQDEEECNNGGSKNHDTGIGGNDSDVEELPDTVFEEMGDTGNKEVKESLNLQADTLDDPFNIYPLLNQKREKDMKKTNSENSLKYPPGFTPVDNNDENVVNMCNGEDGNNVGSGTCYCLNNKREVSESLCSDHFKKSEAPRNGGSILNVLDEVVKVGQVMRYKMDGCMANMADIIESQGAEGETKMDNMELFCVRRVWGNVNFEFVYSDSVGNSGGILCVWDPNSFCKRSATVSDYFIMVRGEWCLTGKEVLFVAVYAPHEFKEKQTLWDYLIHEIGKWNGDVVIMGNFNEVRYKSNRFGLMFNSHGANVFNSFIARAGLVEVPLGGSAFTWCHKSATTMSKLDRFFVSENLLIMSPNLNAVTLERCLEGKMCDEVNAMKNLIRKLKHLKAKIREWNKLATVDAIIDCGNGNEEIVEKRMGIINDLQNVDKLYLIEMAQKAKIKWSIEGDENSRYFHGLINKKRSLLIIRGVLVEGRWIDNPKDVKMEFYKHFSERFGKPGNSRDTIQMGYPRTLSLDQQLELENEVSNEEVKKAVWDCGTDKAPGPDGFTLEFYRKFWYLIEGDVCVAVKYFFTHAFIADRQILDGLMILNEVMQWCRDKKKHALIFKVLRRRTTQFDGSFWMKYLRSSGLVLSGATGSKVFSNLRGDRLLMVLLQMSFSFSEVVEAGMFNSIQLSSSVNISYMFYADDAVFVGQWCDRNINTLTCVLECFYRVSGLRINMCKSKIMGINVESDRIKDAARKLGCLTLTPPFLYLGSTVGGSMSRFLSWKEIFDRVKYRLSTWKMKTLSIGGRLTLLKSVLGSMPIYHISMFKVLIRVLNTLESVRSHFFNGHELNSKKASWVNWRKVLASKEKGGLGISSFYGVFYVLWWHLWVFRNGKLFDAKFPLKEVFYDEVVSMLFHWCRYRCKSLFSWVEWLKSPNLISL